MWISRTVLRHIFRKRKSRQDGQVLIPTTILYGRRPAAFKDNFKLAFPEPAYIKQTYQAICNYYQVAVGAGQGLSVEFDIDKICNSYNLLPVVYNSIKFLEKENYLSFLDGI